MQIKNNAGFVLYKTKDSKTLKEALEEAASLNTDLNSADLRGADLRDANLGYAYLCGADLNGADLRGADLRYASLRAANLGDANLNGADLRGADLRDANLWYTYLWGANIDNTTLPHYQICPASGSFEAYKKVYSYAGKQRILLVRIPETAQRTSILGMRKCRASALIPLKAFDLDGIEVDETTFYGLWDTNFQYNSYELAKPDKYSMDIRTNYTNGLYFFMTFDEAKEFGC